MRDLNGKMSHVPSGPYGGTSRGGESVAGCEDNVQKGTAWVEGLETSGV